MIVDALKAALLLAVAAVVQVTVANRLELVDGPPDLVLLLLCGVALRRGPIFGACAGFWAGLVLDTATLETLGLTSLVLTLAGYWVGRFGESTSLHAYQAPRLLIAVTLATVGVILGSLVLHFILGTSTPIGSLFARVLLPSLALNLLLAYPLYAPCRRLFPPPRRQPEVSVAV